MSEISVPINAPGSSKEDPKNFRIQLLPDIAFLRQLSIQGRMRYFQGTNTAGITIIPTQGETLFIGGGSWTVDGSIGAKQINVQNDGNSRELLVFATTISGNGNFQFGVDSLVGNGVKQFTVTGSAVNTTRFNIWGWVENTSRIRDVTI